MSPTAAQRAALPPIHSPSAVPGAGLPGAPRSPAEVPTHFDHAFNRGDVDAVLAVFDPAASMRMTDGQVIEDDRVALRAAFAGLLGLRPTIHNVVRRVIGSDDIALVLMDWTFTVKTPDGADHVDTGTATQVMQRQPDGSWRLRISNPLGVA